MDLTAALLLMNPKDDRVFFVMPWNNHTLVGTTDESGTFDYNTPTVTGDDINYLLEALNAYSTKRLWSVNDIKGAFAGIDH